MTLALKKATSTIPIVMTQDTDPVGNGFVASLARPGGNITGLTTLAGVGGKRLELLKEIMPKTQSRGIPDPGGAANDLFERKRNSAAGARS